MSKEIDNERRLRNLLQLANRTSKRYLAERDEAREAIAEMAAAIREVLDNLRERKGGLYERELSVGDVCRLKRAVKKAGEA